MHLDERGRCDVTDGSWYLYYCVGIVCSLQVCKRKVDEIDRIE